jgi:hypothetical protein
MQRFDPTHCSSPMHDYASAARTSYPGNTLIVEGVKSVMCDVGREPVC